MNAQPPAGNTALLEAVLEIFEQGEQLLLETNDEAYAHKVSLAFNASIGCHYRHCLDHFRSLLSAVKLGDLNYDHRERGTLVETDRFVALNATRELHEGFKIFNDMNLAHPLAVTCKTNYSTNGSQVASSTIGREIMYAVAHAVHHYALIGIIGGIIGVRTPVGFGVAPATLKHKTETDRAAA